MRLQYYVVDAFVGAGLKGNPAGVCVLNKWLPDERLQEIASENNLSETAFLVKAGNAFDLRWFTPAVEVDLCGHATLASGCVVFNYLHPALERVQFSTKSSILTVSKDDEFLAMDFPSRPPVLATDSPDIVNGLGKEPLEVHASRDLLCLFKSEEEVRSLTPNTEILSRVENLGVIATAPGNNSDFVSRFFAPRAGIPEDPVTGSAHCTLTPFWSQRLGKTELHALQVSARGGEIYCTNYGERVNLRGRARVFMEGEIIL